MELARRNVPYRVVVAGDSWLDYRLSAEQLAPYRAVITTKDDQWLDQGQREVLAAVKSDGRSITWPDDEQLARLMPEPIIVNGSEKLRVFPRVAPGDDQAAVVLHVLNQQYDGEQDAMVPQHDVTIRVRRDLLGNREFAAGDDARAKSRSQPAGRTPRCDSRRNRHSAPGAVGYDRARVNRKSNARATRAMNDPGSATSGIRPGVYGLSLPTNCLPSDLRSAGSFTTLFRVSGIRPVLEHGSASATFAPRPPPSRRRRRREGGGGDVGWAAQPGVNAGPNTRLRRETGVNARHPSMLGTSNLDDLWVRTRRLRRGD